MLAAIKLSNRVSLELCYVYPLTIGESPYKFAVCFIILDFGEAKNVSADRRSFECFSHDILSVYVRTVTIHIVGNIRVRI